MSKLTRNFPISVYIKAKLRVCENPVSGNRVMEGLGVNMYLLPFDLFNFFFFFLIKHVYNGTAFSVSEFEKLGNFWFDITGVLNFHELKFCNIFMRSTIYSEKVVNI